MVNYKPFAFIQSFFLLVVSIHKIKCRSISKEKHYSCSLKPFSWIFADILASGSSFFRLVEMDFFKSFIAASVYGFWVNFKPCVFIQGFFSAVGKYYRNQVQTSFLQFFQFLTVEAVFPASGNEFSIEFSSFPRVETDFFSSVLLFRANFVLVKTIIQIKVKPFLTGESSFWTQ